MRASRRDIVVLAGAALAGGAAGVGQRAWGVPAPARLRPPGAPGERELLAACLRCGQCVEACPEDTLRLEGPGSWTRSGAPYFVPREVPCTLCQDLPGPECIRVCPTDALRPVADVADVRIGVAVLDEQRCLAYTGTICRACWHACPFPDSAIGFDWRLRPVVKPEACTGCGLCERACPTEPSSIVVEPAGGAP